ARLHYGKPAVRRRPTAKYIPPSAFARNGELALSDEHTPRLRALVAGDDAAALEHVDQPPCPCVADPEAPLDERDRGGLGLDDDVDRLLEQRILVRIELLVVHVLREDLGQLQQ